MPDHSARQQIRDTDDVRRSLGLWIWSILLIADCVLLTRGFAGDLSRPLPTGLAILSTTLVATMSLLARYIRSVGHHVHSKHRWKKPGAPFDWQGAVEVLTSEHAISVAVSLAASLGWVCAISPKASSLALGLLCGILIAHAIAVMTASGTGSAAVDDEPQLPAVREQVCRAQAPFIATPEPQSAIAAEDRAVTDFNLEADEEYAEALSADEQRTLWLERRMAGEYDLVEGWMSVTFEEGQREAQLHLSFCPPFAAAPDIETEDLDGAGLEIKVATAFPFGARLSVRRSGPLVEEFTARVGFIAQSEAARRAA